MQKWYSKKAMVGSFLLMLFVGWVLMSCMTPQVPERPPLQNEESAVDSRRDTLRQDLSGEELDDLARWRSQYERVFVQNHMLPSAETERRAFNPWIASYEGFQMASLLGLDGDLSTDEMYRFIRGIFDDMPMEVETAALVKSVVISSWYEDGSPLVINVTRAFAEHSIPVVVYMFNTWGNLRIHGFESHQKAGVAYEYPRWKTAEGDLQKEFMDFYSMVWLNDGFVSASNAFGKELPGFSSSKSDFERIQLTDAWLRDGNLENDAEVLDVLLDVISRDELTPLTRVYSRIQLFMYYLFHGDVASVQAVIDELNDSGLADVPHVAGTEIGILVERDLQRILDIAVRLNSDLAHSVQKDE